MNNIFIKTLVSPLSLLNAITLLCTIVELTGKSLDQSYISMMKALKLIKTQDLLKVLNEAFEEKTLLK